MFCRYEFQVFSGLVKGDFKSGFLIPASKSLLSFCGASYVKESGRQHCAKISRTKKFIKLPSKSLCFEAEMRNAYK